MPRRRNQTSRLAPGSFVTNGRLQASLTGRLLRTVDELAPFVREDLATLLPAYELLRESVRPAPVTDLRWLQIPALVERQIYDDPDVRSSMAEVRIDVVKLRERRRFYLALHDWADRHHLVSDRVLQSALSTLSMWHDFERAREAG